jgi:ribonuclease VapC
MIVVDSSVFVALIQKEPESEALVRRLVQARRRMMSAGNYIECAMVAIGRHGGRSVLDEWLRRRSIEIASVDLDLARIAGDAFARFGKGRDPASLNYGDCFAYALAKSLDAPLLYKGDDFAKTDIRSALP